jgi:hypothetical protein
MSRLDDPSGDPSRRQRPPWWFMPLTMGGLGIAAASLSMVMITIVD